MQMITKEIKDKETEEELQDKTDQEEVGSSAFIGYRPVCSFVRLLFNLTL